MDENDKKFLISFTEEERNKAMERFGVIQPFIEKKCLLSRIARDKSIPIPTLRRWVSNYRQGGLVGLIRKNRTDTGKHRKVPDKLILLIEGLALQKPPRSVASIHRQVLEIAKEKGWPCPSYQTTLSIINNIDPALKTLALEGTKAYQNKYDLIYQRESNRPNEIWQADHCLLNIWVLDENNRAGRPWLTIIMDDYSRAVSGYYLSMEAPSILRTSLTLRQAIWRKEDPRWQIHGIPETFYTDHGSDFTSKHIEQVSADIKMQIVFSIAGQPRGRGKIERFFQTIEQLFICDLTGYTPNGKFPSGGPVLTLKELEYSFLEWLLGKYHLSPHSKTGMLPLERWKSNGFLPRILESEEQLDLLLINVAKSRRIRPDGVHFQGFRYISPVLAAYVGEDVIIRYDPRDMAEIRVFHKEKFLCRATCQELSGDVVSLREIISARNKHRKELKKTISSRAEIVETLLGVHKQPSSLIKSETKNEDDITTKKNSSPGLKRYYNE